MILATGRLLPLTELPNISIPDANDGWDVAQSAIIAVIGLIGLVLVLWLRQVLNQVKNSHSTNLRDDIDELKGVKDDIKDLHDDFRRERTERRADIAELRSDIRSIQQSVGAEP